MRSDCHSVIHRRRYRFAHYHRIAGVESAGDARRGDPVPQRIVVQTVATESFAHIGVEVDLSCRQSIRVGLAFHVAKVAGEPLRPQLLA